MPNRIVEEAHKWIAYADQDLRAAKTLIQEKEKFTSQVCFLSQQAAEKAIKAGLIFLQVDFPFSHDLSKLRNLLPTSWQTYQQPEELETLSNWAVNSCYPSGSAAPSLGQAKTAVIRAEKIIESIKRDIITQSDEPIA